MEWDPLTRMTSFEKRIINTIPAMSENIIEQARQTDTSFPLEAETPPVNTNNTMMAVNPKREIVGLSGAQKDVGGMVWSTKLMFSVRSTFHFWRQSAMAHCSLIEEWVDLGSAHTKNERFER